MRVIEAEGSRQAVCIWSLHLAAAAEQRGRQEDVHLLEPFLPCGWRNDTSVIVTEWKPSHRLCKNTHTQTMRENFQLHSTKITDYLIYDLAKINDGNLKQRCRVNRSCLLMQPVVEIECKQSTKLDLPWQQEVLFVLVWIPWSVRWVNS